MKHRFQVLASIGALTVVTAALWLAPSPAAQTAARHRRSRPRGGTRTCREFGSTSLIRRCNEPHD